MSFTCRLESSLTEKLRFYYFQFLLLITSYFLFTAQETVEAKDRPHDRKEGVKPSQLEFIFVLHFRIRIYPQPFILGRNLTPLL